MSGRYVKRFRMAVEIGSFKGPAPATTPAGYRLVAWNDALIDVHARTKFRAFRHEIDARVFPCLGDPEGCRRLMREIRSKPGFMPAAAWLIAWGQLPEELQWCGTIQAVSERRISAMIQNVGVVPGHRGTGLGSLLISRVVEACQRAGLARVCLEVTADNLGAVRLYERLGFRRMKTVYKTLDDEPVGWNLSTPCLGVAAG
ncbi:MAG: GNAT family N-acetyltransferase [Planctomycetaceae bacterium]